MSIISHKYIFLSISGILVLASVFAIAVWGFRLGIDFTGGSLLEVEFLNKRPATDELRARLAAAVAGLGHATIQPTGEKGVIFRFRHVDEEEHQKIIASLGAGGSKADSEAGDIAIKRFDTIGPTIGNELKQRAFFALAAAIIAIILYISWAFRLVSKPVSSWKYGTVAVFALIHDIAIPAGIFSVLGKFANQEIDALFITALLTVMGFSVHDTIVVFDRIRENLRRSRAGETYEDIVSRSVNETIARSINTSLTTLLALSAIFIFGGASTKGLALALMIGIVAGTYSSICVASPLVVIWNQWKTPKT